MQLKRIRVIAAQLLKTGKNTVWINPEQHAKAGEAMTKEDIKALIAEGIIVKKKSNAHSRGRTRILAAKKKKGRKRGMGKRKGTKNVRVGGKENWMKNVRAQRRTLRELRKKNPKAVQEAGYGTVYKMVKGNYFKGKKYLAAFVTERAKQVKP